MKRALALLAVAVIGLFALLACRPTTNRRARYFINTSCGPCCWNQQAIGIDDLARRLSQQTRGPVLRECTFANGTNWLWTPAAPGDVLGGVYR